VPTGPRSGRGEVRDPYAPLMTSPQRIILTLISLMLAFIVVWVVFFDGPRALILSALGLCAVLLLALLSKRWGNQASSHDGTSQH
jgi:uncharacterized membrane protein YqjE